MHGIKEPRAGRTGHGAGVVGDGNGFEALFRSGIDHLANGAVRMRRRQRMCMQICNDVIHDDIFSLSANLKRG